MRFLKRVAQAHGAQNAAARDDKLTLGVFRRTGMKEVMIGVVTGKVRDHGAFFRMFRIAAGGNHHPQGTAVVPGEFGFV